MSLFEVENYVIIDDMYMGKIIKKIWNGYGVIVKLDNCPDYIDSTIVQYQLLNDVANNSDMKGYMLVKSDNKMRLINKNNLISLIKLELKKERYVYINDKINNNFIYFKNNKLFNIKSTILLNIPVIPITNQTHKMLLTPNKNISDNNLSTQYLSMDTVLARDFEPLIGGSTVNEQLNKLSNYIDAHKLTHYITQPEQIQQLQQINNSINTKELKIKNIGRVHNPYLGNENTQYISNAKYDLTIPQLTNTHLLNNEQNGSSSKESLDVIRQMLGLNNKLISSQSSKNELSSPILHESIHIVPDDYANSHNLDVEKESSIKKKDNIQKYREQDIKEDNYDLYIKNMINNLFINEDEIDYNEIFNDDKLYAGEAERLNILEEGQRFNIIKPSIKAVLEKFEKIDQNLYLDLTNTLLYKHIISDNKIDNVSFGIQLIKKIKDILINIQKSIKFEDGRSLLEQINLFAYLKFKISGGYIIIENESYDLQNIKRIITRDIVENLKLLESQYDQPINYKILSNVILKNKSTSELQKNKDIVIEALNILAQDYFICLQSRVEYLLWTLTRLILCWYSDPILNEHIFKIKILINLYRARGIKEFNREFGVQPVILIVPKYGRDSALKILSHLSYYFFPYKNVGWKESSPSYFNKVDDLIYYTNGSIDLKKYIKHLLKNGNHFISPLSNDFTKIDLPNDSNDIEFKLPKIK